LAKSQGAHLFGIIKLLEFSFLGFYTALNFKLRDIPGFLSMLCFGAIISSMLAVWQFIDQSSIGGVFYYLGERTFNISTIGISTANLNGQTLRPYGAFPHPNVLAFFLLTAIVFASLRIRFVKDNYMKGFLISAIIMSTVTLLLTLSRISIALVISFFFYVIYSKRKTNKEVILLTIMLAAVTGLFSSSLPSWGADFFLRGINFREELFVQSFWIFSNNLYLGIGLNNFFIHQAPLNQAISPILFQPPHNIFALTLLQLGLFGFWIFPAVIILALRRLVIKIRGNNGEAKSFQKSILFVLISIIIAGMFDHFLITLQQGQLILAIILGLSFSEIKG
jgi:hypothetical protein